MQATEGTWRPRVARGDATRLSWLRCLRSLPAVLIAWGAGCAEIPGEEVTEVTGTVSALISDQSHAAGRPGFLFLAPIAIHTPPPTDAFESRLAPNVQIDQLNSAGQTARTLAKYTSDQSFFGEKVRRNLFEEYYVVRFESRRFGLDSTKTYRIRVSVGGRELGFADIDVVNRQYNVRGVDRNRFVPLVNGKTLTIKFRIEKPAVDSDADGVFDWLDNCPDVTNPPLWTKPDIQTCEETECSAREYDCYPARFEQPDADGDGVGDACQCDGHACTAIREVNAGLLHTCAITTDGALYCWGGNESGQLGDGDSAQSKRSLPVRVGSDSDWTAVAAGGNHTCALRGAGELYCWGSNALGQLGDATKLDRAAPVRVGDASDWSTIAAGTRHTCGLRNGELYCWGANGAGQLGNNMTLSRATPTRIGTTNDWSFIGAGANHTCGGRAGQLYCWGDNPYGALGDGTTSSRLAPVRVGSARDWTSVSAGSYHTCGLRGAGTLYCWGYNDEGEVGDASTSMRLTPVLVAHSDWVATAAGAFHNCGLRAGGLYCWGLNSDSALGDGTHENRSVPTRVGKQSGYDSVSAGGFHSCALRDEQLYCWGQNFYGELGDSSFVERSTPVLVSF